MAKTIPANCKGKKGRSGRKTIAQEVEKIKDKIREEITQETLIKLANRVVYKQLENAENTESAIGAKEFALPIALKGISEKIITDVNFKNKSKDDLAKEIADEVANLLQ